MSIAIGAVVVYLVLTVPNDVQAGALMKKAKEQMAAGQNDQARESLSRIVQQYPRTDAAAAATVALVTLADSERHKLAADLAALRATLDAQQKQLAALGPKIDEIAARPIPQPAPPPTPAPAKKKTATKKTTTKKHKRR